MQDYKAVIFDLDGTLYDAAPLRRHLIFKCPPAFLLAERLSRRELKGRNFGSADEAYNELFTRMAAKTHSSVQKVSDWYWTKYMPLQVSILQEHCHLRSWVLPTLADLRRRGIKVACLSDYGSTVEKLGALGIDPALFDTVADAPSLGGFKPCREVFLQVAAKLGAAPADTLVVGDRKDTDGAGARCSGMHYSPSGGNSKCSAGCFERQREY